MAPVLVSIGVVGIALQGFAAEPTPQSGTEPVVASTPALAGPVVRVRADAGLVERGYDGRLRRLDVWPGERAVEVMDLSARSRARAEGVIARRTAVLDGALTEHYELLLRVASSAGEEPAVRSLLAQQLASKLGAVWALGPVRWQVARVLEEDERARYEALVDGYWDAVGLEGDADPDRDALGAKVEESLRLIQRDVERFFERLDRGDGFLDTLAGLAMTPEQERAVYGLLREFGEEFGTNATEADEGRLFWKIFAELDEPRRGLLLRAVSGDDSGL